MKKEELLQQVRNSAARHLISRDELTTAFDAGASTEVSQDEVQQAGVSHILYFVGGAIVFLGISVLIWQNWSTLPTATKILATLGSGVAAYLSGTFLSRSERLEVTGRAFYFISALVMPLGLHVTFDVAGLDTGSHGVQSLVAGILLVTYLLSYYVYRKTLFTIFNVIFASWLFFSFTNMTLKIVNSWEALRGHLGGPS